jgi:YVTN family beta-propeller protein
MKRIGVFALSIVLLVSVISALSAPDSKDIIDIDAGKQPIAVAINPLTNQAFVLNKESRDVSIVDMTKQEIIPPSLKVGGIPESIAINPKTNSVIVAGLDGTVTVIDIITGNIIATIPAGKAPSRIAMDVKNNTAFVTNYNSSNMVVINLKSNQIDKTVRLKNGPLGIAFFDAKQKALIACQYDMNLALFDTKEGVVVDELLVGRYVSEVAANNTTGLAVITNPSGNGILSVYDPETNSIVSTIPVGQGPLFVAIYEKKNIAVVSEYAAGIVSFVDLSAGKVVHSLHTRKGPSGIAIDQDKGIAVVANRLDNKISFINIEAILAAPDSQ